MKNEKRFPIHLFWSSRGVFNRGGRPGLSGGVDGCSQVVGLGEPYWPWSHAFSSGSDHAYQHVHRQLAGTNEAADLGLFGVYVLQADIVIFLREQLPLVSAFHPVLALVDFALALTLVRRSWGLAVQDQTPTTRNPD